MGGGREEEWSCWKFNLKSDGGMDEGGVAGVEERQKKSGLLILTTLKKEED